MILQITLERMRALAPGADPHIRDAIVATAPAVLARHAFAPVVTRHFFTHMIVESGGFSRLDENLNYSAQRLTQVWPARFPSLDAATPFAHNPRALANKVYGGRMGNVGPDDGWLNRGQGLLQITGAKNLTKLAGILGVTIDVLRAWIFDPAHMLEAAASTFVMLGAVEPAGRDDILGSTKAVNGGTTGLAEREAALRHCMAILT